MALPFPEANLEPLIYMVLGSLSTMVAVMAFYIRRLHRRIQNGELSGPKTEDLPEIDKIGLSKRAEDVLGEVLEEPALQNELPDKLKVSKATVSNAVSELNDRHLIKRKKKANTYLIEPHTENIREETAR